MSTWLSVVLLVAWFAIAVGLLVWALSLLTDGRVGQGLAVGILLLTWFFAGMYWVIGSAAGEEGAYRDRCRAAGGVPVDAYRAVNCVTPEGKWIDVE